MSDHPVQPVSVVIGVLRSEAQWSRSVTSFVKDNSLPDDVTLPKPPTRFPALGSLLYVPQPFNRVFASAVFVDDAMRLFKAANGFSSPPVGSDLRLETAMMALLVEGEVCTEERAIAMVREVCSGKHRELRRRLARSLLVPQDAEGG